MSAPDPACELPLPLSQSAAYARATGSERFSIWRGQRYLGEVGIMHRRIFGLIRVARIIRGPIWRVSPLPEDWVELLALLKTRYTRRYRHRLFWVPPETEARMDWRNQGLHEWMNGGWHGWLDIRQDANAMRVVMEKKWHQALVRGESVEASIIPHALKSDAAHWVLSGGKPFKRAITNRAARRALTLHRRGASLRIYTLQHGRTTLWTREEALAGALFIRHGNSATYHMGLASHEAWEQGFMHRLLWQSILSLKKEGVHWLYMGPLYGTKALEEPERFVLGTGARPARDGGIWIA